MQRVVAVLIDWGTTNARAWALDGDGAMTGGDTLALGIRNVVSGAFPDALARLVAQWSADPAAIPRILMSGMVGSRQGWWEAAYCDCPVGADELGARLAPVPGFPNAAIVPGVCRGRASGRADVMRGEEVQAFGAMAGGRRAVMCLPGTHSKWVLTEGGRIVDFASAMTGEAFELLARHSLLGATMNADAEPDDRHFRRGLDMSVEPGGLLGHLFSARAEALFDRLPRNAGASYLSGMLIGHEIHAMRDLFAPDHAVQLVAGGALAERYALAFDHLDVAVEHIDAAQATMNGLRRILEGTTE